MVSGGTAGAAAADPRLYSVLGCFALGLASLAPRERYRWCGPPTWSASNTRPELSFTWMP